MGKGSVRGYHSAILVVTAVVVLISQVISTGFRSIHLRMPVRQTVEKSKLTETKTVSETPQFTVRTIIIFHTGVPNYEAIIAWIEYHRKRWGVTHVDVFVKENLSEMRAILNHAVNDSVKIELVYTQYHKYPVPVGTGLDGYRNVMINRAFQNAKRDNNTFTLFMDPDEFLISKDFRDFEEMFKGGHDAVSFPMFGCNYEVCSDNALVFGSLGYQEIVPYSSKYTSNSSLDFYTEPQVSCGGHRKYVVRTEKWDRVEHDHDPIECTMRVLRANLTSESRRRVLYLTGRHQDGEHARLIHLRNDRGIHGDLTMNACVKVRSCDFVRSDGVCINGREGAKWERIDTEITQLLKDRPLFPDAARVSLDAVCYAERYPVVRKRLCDGDIKKCRYGALYRHYYDVGRGNLTWGCDM